jgi:hypothetical protein
MKPLPTYFKIAILCAILNLVSNTSYSQTTLFPYGSTWRYLDNGSDQGTAWRASGFNHSSWATGAAELGYGDSPVTTVSYGPNEANKYITTYFRQNINITNPASYSSIGINVRRDDGIVIYINGTERYRNNLPGSPTAITYTTLAPAAASDDGATPQSVTLLTSYFNNGNNVVAVEVHQNSAGSTDLTFDLEIVGNFAPVNMISFGANWSYLDNNTRPVGWETTSFNYSGWAVGASELGYGDAPATAVSYGGDVNNRHITTYFRRTFNVTGLSTLNSITMNIVRDDGMVVYINGKEVARDNLPGGTPAHSTLASTAISDAGETTPITFSISPCDLVEGTNYIAVEMHQSSGNSSDLSFNMELIGSIGGGTPSLSRGPYLQMGSETAITLRWRTSSVCEGRVRVGTALGSYTVATATESCATTEHVIRITGLSPDTKYFYEIGTVGGTVFQATADNFFTTAPPANTTRKVRIAAFGDCGRGNSTYQDQTLAYYQHFIDSIGVEAADAWILMGDNAYSSGTDNEYTTGFFNIYGPNMLKNHKLYPSPGNHDYGNNAGNKSSRSMPYYNIFTTPRLGESGGVASNKPNFYSFNVGDIHFLSLDSWGIESDATDMGSSSASALKTWLAADLAANTRKWVVAYWHHPPYTKTSHDSDNNSTDPELIRIRQNFITYLETRGVDLIINGHSHGYERGYLTRNYTGNWASFIPGTHNLSSSNAKYINGSTCPYVYNSTPLNHGTVYVVAGSAGASGGTHTGFNTGPMPFSVNDGGVLYFEVEGNRLDAKMLRRTGAIHDQFTIMKDVNQSTTYNIVTGNTIALTASWPGNHSWNTTATTRSINVTPATSGTTVYNVTDGLGCITDQFTVIATGTLPVSLLEFNVVPQSNNKVLVTWATASEDNNDYFTIERSENGRDYTVIGQVNSSGNSGTRQDYTFTDHAPAPGTSYYRLSQTDLDGKVKHLGIKRLANNSIQGLEVKTLGVNNGQLVLQISSSAQVDAQIRIFDLSGRERKNEKITIMPGVSRKDYTVGTGVYIWEVRTGKGDAFYQKVIVQ